MNLDLSTRLVAQRAVVAVAGEVDLETASQLSDHALVALREVSPHIALDVSDVSFMDSTGLKVLLSVARRSEAAKGSFAVVGASRTVLRLLSLTGLDQAFPLCDSVDDLPPITASGPPPTTGSSG
jgi:anti-anti-sigma factor